MTDATRAGALPRITVPMPVRVTAWLLLDSAAHHGLLYGWRGPVAGVREFAPGFAAEFLAWVRAEDVRQRIPA